MRVMVATKLGDVLQKELISTCSPSISNSTVQSKDIEALQSFKWTHIAQDLCRTAPLLSIILHKCAGGSRHTSCPSNKDVVIGVVAGILLRNCSQRANLLQRLLSILLYSSHAPKQVSNRLDM